MDFQRGETDDNDLINATVLDPLTLRRLGFNPAVLTPARRLNFSPRVDYAFNDKSHTLVARYSYFKNDQKNHGVSTVLSARARLRLGVFTRISCS